MNERIKELYLQAHSIRRYDGDPALDGNPPTVYWQGEVSAQRFAELIVQECIRCCDDVDAIQKHYLKYGIDQELDAKQCIEVIKKHFGVE